MHEGEVLIPPMTTFEMAGLKQRKPGKLSKYKLKLIEQPGSVYPMVAENMMNEAAAGVPTLKKVEEGAKVEDVPEESDKKEESKE